MSNNQIVYLCGPHGVGKSTLINDLKQYDMGRVKEQVAHMEGLTDIVSRQIWRASLHCIEHRENLAYAVTQPPNSVVIGDRCFLDDQAYMAAFVDLGWLPAESRDGIVTHTDNLYTITNTPKPEKFIVLLPPLEWNIDRIKERWSEGIIKWHEDDFNYLRRVRDNFEFLVGKKKAEITVVRETDRKKRVTKVKEWLVENNLDDFIVEGRTYIEGMNSGTGS